MTAATTPPIVVDLTWQGGMRFAAQSEKVAFTLDGSGETVPTPVQALAGCLAACMGIDLAQILTKGRHDLKELRAHLVGDRRGEDPKHFTRFRLHVTITGDVPREAIERAVPLSRQKYCSVWHSLRRDLDLQTTFEAHT